ncbi:MAG: hypothetical protein VX278_13700, partial [Myxococcota bacterium]|nr:hypothetical protein [Myxococcota bacterium]
MTSDTLNNLYPNPTIVVGVGDFGLACLEQLGESWLSHKTGGGDASLRNLRLLHIRSGCEDPLEWVKAETRFGSLLERLQDTKLPAMALAWAILRSIGLIRYNTGQFEVAMLHDAGLVSREKHSTTEETHAASTDTASKSKKPKSRKEKSKEVDEKAKKDDPNDDPQEDVLLRRRYFTWTKIGTDPHASAQRLEEIRQNNGAFDSFVGPIIHRVILGHSPKILTSLIARFKAMKQGFDPSPWHWLQALGEFEDQDGNPKKTVTRGSGYSTYELSENIGDTARHTHNELISENLQKSWGKKFKDYDPLRKGKDKKRLMRVPKVFQYFEYLKSCRPDAFQNYHETHDIKEADIYRDPLRTLYPSMSTVLSHDFESGKWEEEGGKIKILDVSDYILGMYDHDEVERGESFVNHLKVRIQEFGKLVEKGLMRLWVDLSLDPGWETAYASEQSRQRIHIVDCIYQSLYLLGELVVQPVLKEDLDDGFEDDWDIHKKIDTFHDDIWTDGIKLPSEPSQTLRHMELITDIAENKERRKLESRLVNVGVSLDDYDVPIRHLYRSAYYFPT